MLDRQRIPFTYEDAVYVEESNGNDKKGRIWHPDFHLHDSGVLVEYVGSPHDPEYMKGIQKKEESVRKDGRKRCLAFSGELVLASGYPPVNLGSSPV